MSEIDIPLEMKIKYLERRKQDYDDCLKALSEKNYELFLKVGHQVKGNAVSFGYADLGLIAAHLEKAAAAKDIQKIESLLSEFKEFLNQKNK